MSPELLPLEPCAAWARRNSAESRSMRTASNLQKISDLCFAHQPLVVSLMAAAGSACRRFGHQGYARFSRDVFRALLARLGQVPSAILKRNGLGLSLLFSRKVM